MTGLVAIGDSSMVPLIPFVAAMIAIGPGVAVTGRVLDDKGQPIAGARVS